MSKKYLSSVNRIIQNTPGVKQATSYLINKLPANIKASAFGCCPDQPGLPPYTGCCFDGSYCAFYDPPRQRRYAYDVENGNVTNCRTVGCC